jgi:hypothetical protein
MLARSLNPLDKGRLIAELLTGSWRAQPPSIDLDPDCIAEITSILLRTGTAPLVWRRLCQRSPGALPWARQLKQAHQMSILQDAIHEREIVEAFQFLRKAGVEPLLAKGWAVARIYPERGLRPYGDIDIYVRPEQRRLAKDALAGPRAPLPIELADTWDGLDADHTIDELFARSQIVHFGGIDIRIFGPEDHLRLLCRHAMRHGIWRPLWLCDIAAIVEAVQDDFDWDYFAFGDRIRTESVFCALALSSAILKAKSPSPIAEPAQQLPRWAIPAALKEWGATEHYMLTPGLQSYSLRNPRELWHAIRLRWPNPIQATTALNARFDNFPRWPFQTADFIRRFSLLIPHFAKK